MSGVPYTCSDLTATLAPAYSFLAVILIHRMSIFGAPPQNEARMLRFIEPPAFSSVLARWVWPGLDVRPTRVGYGLFASRAIDPGRVIPYTGELFTDEWIERRAAHDIPHSRYVLENFDADPEVPACRQQYCIAGFANEAYDARTYNCALVTFNENDGAETVCKEMPAYHHFDSWGGFLVNFRKLQENEELCVWYGASYSGLRDYVAKPFVADEEYKALVRVIASLKTAPRPLPVSYKIGEKRLSDDSSWDFEASFIVNGRPRWFKGRIVGRRGDWVDTVFEDGEERPYRKNPCRFFWRQIRR